MRTFFMKKKKAFSPEKILTFLAVILSPAIVSAAAWYTVRFTSPGEATQEIKNFAVAEIDGAGSTVYAALYDLNSEEVARAMINAKERGVRVLVVTENENMDRDSVVMLKQNGIPVIDDGKSGLMHNKFIIIDGQHVMTGSLNYTENGFYRNNNNLVLIKSEQCAAIYTKEFFEMFTDRIFQNRKEKTKKDADDYYFRAGDVPVNVYFSPDDDIERILNARIRKAKKSVNFMAFSFTSEKTCDAMLAAAGKGVRVSGVFERRGSSSQYSCYGRLKKTGIDVRLDRNPGNMHHKVLIIDGETVIFGSYNFSRSASRSNDENIIIVKDPSLAALFLSEFERIFNSSDN